MADRTDPGDDVRLECEVAIRAGLDAVWELLSTSTGRAAWFGTHADIDLVVGGASVVGWADEQSIEATVAAVEPRRHLRLEYVVDGVEAGAEEYWLDHDDGVTRVRLLQTLPPPSDEGGWEGFYGDLERGWRLFLASLRYAAQDAAVPHRTVDCRIVPVEDRLAAWSRMLHVLGLDDAPAQGDQVDVAFTGTMDVALVDPPNSLLLTTRDRTLLHDLEGAGGRLVMYVQAATHGINDDIAASAWRTRVLEGLARSDGEDPTR